MDLDSKTSPEDHTSLPTKHFRHEEDLRELAVALDYDARRIARHLGISTRQLQRIFKARLNCSPVVWLREQRLLRAREMLPSSCSVKRVAYSLGFSQVSQFCRDFKARFGHRPSAERGDSRPCPLNAHGG